MIMYRAREHSTRKMLRENAIDMEINVATQSGSREELDGDVAKLLEKKERLKSEVEELLKQKEELETTSSSAQ